MQAERTETATTVVLLTGWACRKDATVYASTMVGNDGAPPPLAMIQPGAFHTGVDVMKPFTRPDSARRHLLDSTPPASWRGAPSDLAAVRRAFPVVELLADATVPPEPALDLTASQLDMLGSDAHAEILREAVRVGCALSQEGPFSLLLLVEAEWGTTDTGFASQPAGMPGPPDVVVLRTSVRSMRLVRILGPLDLARALMEERHPLNAVVSATREQATELLPLVLSEDWPTVEAVERAYVTYRQDGSGTLHAPGRSADDGLCVVDFGPGEVPSGPDGVLVEALRPFARHDERDAMPPKARPDTELRDLLKQASDGLDRAFEILGKARDDLHDASAEVGDDANQDDEPWGGPVDGEFVMTEREFVVGGTMADGTTVRSDYRVFGVERRADLGIALSLIPVMRSKRWPDVETIMGAVVWYAANGNVSVTVSGGTMFFTGASALVDPDNGPLVRALRPEGWTPRSSQDSDAASLDSSENEAEPDAAVSIVRERHLVRFSGWAYRKGYAYRADDVEDTDEHVVLQAGRATISSFPDLGEPFVLSKPDGVVWSDETAVVMREIIMASREDGPDGARLSQERPGLCHTWLFTLMRDASRERIRQAAMESALGQIIGTCGHFVILAIVETECEASTVNATMWSRDGLPSMGAPIVVHGPAIHARVVDVLDDPDHLVGKHDPRDLTPDLDLPPAEGERRIVLTREDSEALVRAYPHTTFFSRDLAACTVSLLTLRSGEPMACLYADDSMRRLGLHHPIVLFARSLPQAGNWEVPLADPNHPGTRNVAPLGDGNPIVAEPTPFS